MSYCKLVNSGSWAPTGIARPPRALKMNPVKDLHSNYYGSKDVRKEIDFSMARFKISTLIESLQALPSCYVVDFANRPCACKCMADPKLSPEVITEAAEFLRSFALLKKDQQQGMIVEWIKYASLSKETLLGHSADSQRRVWLLPGTTFPVCRNALQRVIGYGSKAFDRCREMAKQNINPTGQHGLKGRTGKDSNRSNDAHHELMDTFFSHMQDLCTPRATRIVRNISGRVELRDDEENLVELPPYLTRSGCYRRFVADCGHEIYYDARHRVTGTLPIAGKEQKAFPSERTFVDFWDRYYPHIIPQRVRADICGDCYTFSNSHRFITGVLAREEKEKQDTRREQEYSPSADNDESSAEAVSTIEAAEAEKTRLVDKQEQLVMDASHHVDMARRQRDLFRDKKSAAVCDRLAGKPMHERVVTWVADYSQNVCVPNFAGKQPGDTYYYSPCNAYVFGIADCSVTPTPLTAHVALEDLGKKGGNNIASCLAICSSFQSHWNQISHE